MNGEEAQASVCQRKEERKEGLFEGCRRKKVPRQMSRARKEPRTRPHVLASSHMSRPLATHPSESKQRMHVKRLGCGHLPAIHHALFSLAVRLPSRMVCFTRPKWDGGHTKRDTVAAA
jgi:hypothetical protein